MDFASLDPETRAFALVGQFLKRWSEMEAALDDCLQAAFELSPPMRRVLCANLGFRDKLNILAAACRVLGLTDPAPAKLIDHLDRRARSRNIVAHNRFQPDPAGNGLTFVILKSRESPEKENVELRWSNKKFEEERGLIAGLEARLNDLKLRLQRAPAVDMSGLPVSAWLPSADWSVPMRRTFSPALLHALHGPPLPPLDPEPARDSTDPQKPETPEE